MCCVCCVLLCLSERKRDKRYSILFIGTRDERFILITFVTSAEKEEAELVIILYFKNIGQAKRERESDYLIACF